MIENKPRFERELREMLEEEGYEGVAAEVDEGGLGFEAVAERRDGAVSRIDARGDFGLRLTYTKEILTGMGVLPGGLSERGVRNLKADRRRRLEGGLEEASTDKMGCYFHEWGSLDGYLDLWLRCTKEDFVQGERALDLIGTLRQADRDLSAYFDDLVFPETLEEFQDGGEGDLDRLEESEERLGRLEAPE